MNKFQIKIYRSNKNNYAQLFDLHENKIIFTLSSSQEKGTKSERAYILGEKVGEKLKNMKINKVIFYRGKYKYHGRVKQIAQGIRDKGVTI